MFLTSWGRFQRRFDNIIDDLKRHGDLIDREASARNISEAQKMRQEIRAWREESLDQVKQIEEEQAARQYREILSWLKVDESEQLSIQDSISEEAAKYPGTCGWILKSPKVSAWLMRKPEMPFVWLQGNPGTGKSVLSNQLVKFMTSANCSVSSYFCTYTYTSSTKYDMILKSLLTQLLRYNHEVTAHVYEDCIIGKKLPTLLTMEQLVHTAAIHLSDKPRETKFVWLVIDGVDECETERQPRLVRLLNRITTRCAISGGSMCKVLISSRFSSVLFKLLQKKPTISLSHESEGLKQAIRRYVAQRLQGLNDIIAQLEMNPADIGNLEKIIATKADGMFLYARLVLDYVSTNLFYSGDELKQSIVELPPTLTEFYQEILNQILLRLDSRSVDRIRCVLGWVAFAKRPLKRLEFLSALSYSSGNSNVDRLVPQYILDKCSPLIEERRDTSWAFIHVSVKDFLQNSSNSIVLHEMDTLREHGLASVTCLISGFDLFLPQTHKATRHIRLIKGIHGFHVYATEFWTEYILVVASISKGFDTKSPFYLRACELVQKLEHAVSADSVSMVPGIASDERIQWLQGHSILSKHVDKEMKLRSQKRLESVILREQGKLENPF
jgi:hypothetical protein